MIDVDYFILSKKDYDYCLEHHYPNVCDCAAHDLAVEIKALRGVEKAARQLIRGLELCQEFGESVEEGWKTELEMQQALIKLDEARRG